MKQIFTSKYFWYFGVFPATTGLIFLLRSLGLLESLELAGLDRFIRQKGLLPPSGRVALVKYTQADIDRYGNSIPDRELLQSLIKIQKQKPTAIGLELIRDNPPSAQLNTFLAQNLVIGVEQARPLPHTAVKPIPILKQAGRTNGADLTLDPDRKIRRAYLFAHPLDGSIEASKPSFAGMLARLYLIKNTGNDWAIDVDRSTGKVTVIANNVAVDRFAGNNAGYVNHPYSGFSFFLNQYNITAIPQISVSDLLDDRVPNHFFKDKIVLLGSTNLIGAHLHYVPPNRRLFSLEIHANTIESFLGATLDKKPTIKTLSQSREVFITGAWLALFAVFVEILRRKTISLRLLIGSISIVTILLSVILYNVNFWVFNSTALWLPLIPPLLGIPIAAVSYIAAISLLDRQRYAEQISSSIRESIDINTSKDQKTLAKQKRLS
ncbi:MAG: CHASE2 domain-containing protein [Prochloraceae cyanobacterium]